MLRTMMIITAFLVSNVGYAKESLESPVVSAMSRMQQVEEFSVFMQELHDRIKPTVESIELTIKNIQKILSILPGEEYVDPEGFTVSLVKLRTCTQELLLKFSKCNAVVPPVMPASASALNVMSWKIDQFMYLDKKEKSMKNCVSSSRVVLMTGIMLLKISRL